jgi:hypothetical protein
MLFFTSLKYNMVTLHVLEGQIPGLNLFKKGRVKNEEKNENAVTLLFRSKRLNCLKRGHAERTNGANAKNRRQNGQHNEKTECTV